MPHKHDGHHSSGSKSHWGDKQGDMSPHVEDYQKPMADFAESDHSKTLEYISRQDKFVSKQAKKVESQAYQGRYS